MDPILSTIILGAITNGLTSTIAFVGRRSAESLEPFLFTTTLQETIESAVESTEFRDEQQAGQVRAFLESPETEQVARQIFAVLSEESPKTSHDLIFEEFLASLSLCFLEEPTESLKPLAQQLFSALLKGCKCALDTAIEKGVLAAHEAKSTFRHRMLMDEIKAIQKNIALLAAPHKFDIQEILQFEKTYRQQVNLRHGFIVPPYFDALRKLSIDDLYVPSDFIRPPVEKDQAPIRLRMPELLSSAYRAVILGNPGGGKSTFSSKLCYDLTEHYSERLLAGRQATPILVVLRDYGAEKKKSRCSIRQFIEITANSIYQVQPPANAFEYLLLNGRTVVVFDGLDELLDTSYRQEISNDIEAFCNLYPSVPVLVTSRKVGYEQVT